MGAGPSAVVSPPPAGAPRIGLIVSARRPEDGSDRWQNGFTYLPEGCVEGESFDPCATNTITPPTNPETVEWEPIKITVSFRCSSYGFEGKDWGDLARRRLAADEERQLGLELWDGDVAQAAGWSNRWLADVGNVDILSESGPVGLVHGLACLEQYLAETNGGQQGMIHATAQVVTHWASFRLLRREGNRILTFHDTIVVPSPGYSGNAPDGTTGSDNIWAYATDMVEVRLSEVVVFDALAETLNRTTNDITVVAERLGIASWQGCRHGGVRLAVDSCDVGGS